MLSSHFPDLRGLEVLLAVARTGSFNTAAAGLGISQQAVSARVAALEAQSRVLLVARSPRGSTLTPAGAVVAEWAARLLDVAAELDAGLAALRHDRQTKLRVSASLTIAEQLLPGWLVGLNREAQHGDEPEVEVVLRATNSEHVAADVLAGDAELGFVEGPDAPPGLRSRSIGHDSLVLVIRPDHRWARRRTPLRPAEVASTLLVAREEGSGTREALERALRAALGADAGLAPPALALSTSSAVRAAVIAGAGPAVLSHLVVSDDLVSGRLLAVPVDGLDLSRTLRAVWTGSTAPPIGAARRLVAIAARRLTPPMPRPGMPGGP